MEPPDENFELTTLDSLEMAIEGVKGELEELNRSVNDLLEKIDKIEGSLTDCRASLGQIEKSSDSSHYLRLIETGLDGGLQDIKIELGVLRDELRHYVDKLNSSLSTSREASLDNSHNVWFFIISILLAPILYKLW